MPKREELANTTDYSHRFHAGNVGDVLKHAALVALLRAVTASARGPLAYVETHAGEGQYALGPTGEWTAGIARLAAAENGSALSRYRELVRPPAPATAAATWRYPGSPLLAAQLLRDDDRLCLCERDAEAHEELAAHFRGDQRARTIHGDGFAALPEVVAAADAERTVVLIDPPYVEKGEWEQASAALTQLASHTPAPTALLWYPIKSLTRPNALVQRLRQARVAARVVELITTPIELRKNRLNGSGLVLLNVSDEVAEQVVRCALSIGPSCATHEGAWTLRAQGWS